MPQIQFYIQILILQFYKYIIHPIPLNFKYILVRYIKSCFYVIYNFIIINIETSGNTDKLH